MKKFLEGILDSPTDRGSFFSLSKLKFTASKSVFKSQQQKFEIFQTQNLIKPIPIYMC